MGLADLLRDKRERADMFWSQGKSVKLEETQLHCVITCSLLNEEAKRDGNRGVSSHPESLFRGV